MAANGIRLGLVLVMAATAIYGATAQSGCTSALMSLSPCINYVTGNTSTPSSSCCSQLSGVVSSKPQCLCQLVNGGGGSSIGITINQTRALALPSDCKVKTPPASSCATGGSNPSDSPGSSNSNPKTPATGSSPSTPSDGNSVPATTGTSSGASFGAGMQLYVTASIVLLASCASGFVRL